MKHLFLNIFFTMIMFFSCAESKSSNEQLFYIDTHEVVSGETLKIKSDSLIDLDKNYTVSLINSNKDVIETYLPIVFKDYFIINRFLKQKITSLDNYSLLIKSEESSQTIPIQIMPSIIIESFCAKLNCQVMTGNILQNVSNRITVNTFKFKPIKFSYVIITPYQSFEKENVYNTPTEMDWMDNVVLQSVPEGISFYVARVDIKAYDNENNFVETSLPFKVVRPIEVKHFGKYELAEIYEPIPVTGCIPGTVGNNVQYSESESETRQNSVSVTINKNWSDSLSLSNSQSSNALCFVLRERSTLNFLHNASKELDDPGNLFLATSKESITNFLSILSLFIKPNSPSKKLKSKGALWIIIFFSLIKSKNSSAILSKLSLSTRNSSENPWILNASLGIFLLGLINLWKTFPVGIKSFVSIQAISTILWPSLNDKPVVSVSRKISFIFGYNKR